MNIVFFLVGFTLIAVLIVVVTVIVLALRYFRELPPDRAVVITGMTGRRTAKLVGALIVPKLDRADYIDISPKTIELDRELHTKDAKTIRAHAAIELRVRPTPSAVMLAADAIGPASTFDEAAVRTFFGPRLEAALDQLAKEHASEELLSEDAAWKSEFAQTLEIEAQGYMLASVSIAPA